MVAIFAERHALAAGPGEQDAPDRLQVAARLLREADHDGDPPLPLDDARGLGARERGLDRLVDVGDVDAVARHRRAIQGDLDLLHAGDLLDPGVVGAADAAEDRRRLVGEPLEQGDVVAVDLHGEIALDARRSAR